MKPGRFEAAVLTLILLIALFQLFIPPLIGIADNGDFERLRIPNGLQRIPQEATDQRFRFMFRDFAIVAKPIVGIYYFHSSTHLFVAAARWLNEQFVSRETFDIRTLAAVYLACLLPGIYLLLRFSRNWTSRWRCLLAAFFVCIFSDAAFLAYFNSFYSEPTALVALVIAVGCAALLIDGGRGGVALLIGYFIAATVFVTAKPMFVPFAAIFVPFGIFLSRFAVLRHRYLLSAALSGGLIALGLWYQAFTPGWLRLKASYIAIFGFILKGSPAPIDDGIALNLKPEWIRYIGTTPYDADSPVVVDPAFNVEFSKRVRTSTIPLFLLTHPARLYRIAARIAPKMMVTRPDYAGYYEQSSGKPARAKPVAPWSALRARMFPASLWLMLMYFVTGGVALGLGLRRGVSESTRGLLFLFTLLVACAALTYLIPIFTMASIDTRYSATFVLAFDLSLPLAAGLLLRYFPGTATR